MVAYCLSLKPKELGDRARHSRQSPPIPEAPARSVYPVLNSVAGYGTLKGSVTIVGPLTVQKPLKRKGEKFRDLTLKEDVIDESLVISRDRGVDNVVIFLTLAPEGFTPAPPPKKPVVFEIHEDRFIPHVLFVRTGQFVEIINKSNRPASVHTHPRRNRGVIRLLQMNGSTIRSRYARPEKMPLRVHSNFYPWMSAYHLSLPHPFAAVTRDGKFQIDKLPAGTHEFTVWHERAGYIHRALRVVVKPNEVTEVQLKIPAAKFR